jgi:hypothetical protein
MKNQIDSVSVGKKIKKIGKNGFPGGDYIYERQNILHKNVDPWAQGGRNSRKSPNTILKT